MPQDVANTDDRIPRRGGYSLIKEVGSDFAASEMICSARSVTRRKV
jgi:hypothetical protein